jgi:S-methylmethionine-dependent homocysteine/selenocysteine methylase
MFGLLSYYSNAVKKYAQKSSLESGKAIVIDGATGTELERRGAAMDGKAWCAMATLTDSAPRRPRDPTCLFGT